MYDEEKAKECLSLRDVDRNEGQIGFKISISNVIGEFGWFQAFMVAIAFTRYIILAMMTNSGALIAPEAKFQCQIPASMLNLIELPSNMTLDEYSKNRCHFKLKNQEKPFTCSKFTYLDLQETGKTMTNTFDLVCDRDSLRSTFQSVVTLGVISSAIAGSLSDRFGRAVTYKLCFLWSLLFGIASYLAPNYLTFTISRSLTTLGDVGLVISVTAIVVETLGNKYRGTMCIIIYTGWSVGVAIMPWLIDFFKDFQQLMFFCVTCHILTLPWMWWTVGESVRWLLVEGYFEEAKTELLRITAWNTRQPTQTSREFEPNFEKLHKKYINVAEKRSFERQAEASWTRWKYYYMLPLGGLSKMGELFLTRELTIVTLATAWITFNGEFFYMFTTQINSDIGDTKLNYAIGGVMEILATLISIVMISLMPRKLSLFVTLSVMSSTCLSLATSIQYPTLSTWIFNFLKFATSTLTSIVYVIVTELYPTNLRQTGMGVTSLMGSSGAFIAPYVRTEIVKMFTLPTVLYAIALAPALGLMVIFLIRETRGVDIADDIDELCDTTNENLSEANGTNRNSS